MDLSAAAHGPKNFLGAAIFWLYVLFALAFTATIASTLFELHQRHRVTDNNALRTRHVWVFGFFSLLSFSTLSFNMLEVLIQSFQLWSHGQYPSLLTGYLAAIWNWSITSNLFQDFGEAIVANSARFLWTQSALLATIAVCFFMAMQGRQHNVPRLWAFFCISQILPISFAQNLFYVALLLSKRDETQPARVPKLMSVATLALYCSCLANAQLTAGTAWLLPLILVARVFLLVPWALVTKQNEGKRETERQSDQYLATEGIIPVLTLTSLVMTAIKVWQIKDEGWTLESAWNALFSHPAVSSLGCDFILSTFSFVAWSLLSDESIGKSGIGQRKRQ